MLALTGSWQPMFYLLAVVSLVLAAVSWKVDPGNPARGSPAPRRAAADRRAFAGPGPRPGLRRYALTVAFAYASLFAYISASSFVLQDLYGLSATNSA